MTIDIGFPLEMPQGGKLNEYLQHILMEKKKHYHRMITKDLLGVMIACLNSNLPIT